MIKLEDIGYLFINLIKYIGIIAWSISLLIGGILTILFIFYYLTHGN